MQDLTYELLGGTFEALGRFLVEKKMSDADFEIKGEGRLVGWGSIEKDPSR